MGVRHRLTSSQGLLGATGEEVDQPVHCCRWQRGLDESWTDGAAIVVGRPGQSTTTVTRLGKHCDLRVLLSLLLKRSRQFSCSTKRHRVQ